MFDSPCSLTPLPKCNLTAVLLQLAPCILHDYPHNVSYDKSCSHATSSQATATTAAISAVKTNSATKQKADKGVCYVQADNACGLEE